MSSDIKRRGRYLLFDTTQRYHMIALDDQDFFVWRGPERLELSDMGHEAAEILHQGEYFLFNAHHEPGFDEEVTHLACQIGAEYRVYMLPQGLPSQANRMVDIIESQELLTKHRLPVKP